MAISYTTQALILADAQFTERCDLAAANAATNILGEVTSGSAETDAKRQDMAWKILNEDAAILRGLRRAALVNIGAGSSTAIDGSPAEIPDADIDTAVAAVWNDVAGVTTLEAP